MSYILDALRRADAERERGAVPSLHAQQYASLPDDDEPRRRPKPIVWVVVGLTLALVAAVVWNFVGHDAPRPQAIAKAPDAATPAAPTAPPAATPITGSRAPAATGAAAGAASAAPAETPPPVRKTVRRPPPPSTAPAPATGSPDASRTSSLPAPRGTDFAVGARPGDSIAQARGADPAGVPATRGSEAGGDGRVYALRDLPEEIRRTLPTVAVSGSTYSSDRASRMLMINGQIFHEGDVVSNGLVLQQIKPRGAVFSFKGFRYETGF